MRTACLFLTAVWFLAGGLQGSSHVFVSLTSGATSLSQIDGTSGRPVNRFSTVPGVQNLALSPNGQVGVLLSTSSNSAATVNLASGTVAATIPLGSTPWSAFFNAAGSTAFVIASDNTPDGDSSVYTLHLFAIDVATATVVADKKFPTLYGPVSMEDTHSSQFAVSPDATKLYFLTGYVGGTDGAVAVFELPSLQLSSVAPLGGSEFGFSSIVATPDGKHLVLGGGTLGTPEQPVIAVYTAGTYKLAASVDVPGFVENMVIAPDGESVYAALDIAGKIYLETVSLPSLALSQGLEIDNFTYFCDLAISPDGSRLLAGSTIIDLPSQVVGVAQIDSFSSTVVGAFTQADDLWVVNEYSTQLAVLETGSAVITHLVPFGETPGETYPGARGVVYALNGNSIATVNLSTNQITSNVYAEALLITSETYLAAGAGKLFIASAGPPQGILESYDPATGQFAELSATMSGTNITGLLNSPDGGHLYVELYSPYSSITQSLVVFDTATGARTGGSDVNPSGAMAINASGATLYVNTAGGNTNEITVLDLTGKNPPLVFPLSGTIGFAALLISPDGSTLYGLGSYTPTVSVIDAATGSMLASYPAGMQSNSMAITPDGKQLYLSDELSNDLLVIQTGTGVETKIDVGSPSGSVSISDW